METAGYLPLALSAQDYLKLLPTRWQAVNSYGIKIRHRIHDCDELDGLRREKSGLADHKDRWEVRHDPYDVRLVWLHDHREDTWITVPWRLLSSQPVPFGETAWDHSARDLREQQGSQVTEEAIAEAVGDLLERAGTGPAVGEDAAPPARRRARSRRSERAAARTRAAAEPSWPRPASPSGPVPPQAEAAEEEVDDGEAVADVVPLRVFDARKEAKKWSTRILQGAGQRRLVRDANATRALASRTRRHEPLINF
ncbi:hypothetical protein [Streptomyces zinciresistens]|uniref:hypothetical protein n=1 Tax=Streptomyces zinciresistens TaxID=1073330 RepID=UPI0007C544EF